MDARSWEHLFGGITLRHTIGHPLVRLYGLMRRTQGSVRYRLDMPFPALMIPYYGYATLLLFAPIAFRREVGREIRDSFYDAMVAIYTQEGMLDLLIFIAYNFWDAIRTVVELHTEPVREKLYCVLDRPHEPRNNQHFIYYRRGISSIRIVINRPIIDIRLRVSYRAMLVLSICLVSIVVGVMLLTATATGQLALILPGWL